MGAIPLTQVYLNSYKSQNVQKTFFASFHWCIIFVTLEIIYILYILLFIYYYIYVLMWYVDTDIGNTSDGTKIQETSKCLACYCIPFSCIVDRNICYKKELPVISEFFNFLFWLKVGKQSYSDQNNSTYTDICML